MAACCILRAVKKRILVVEDDVALARVLSDSLSYSGFEVETVEGGPEVLSTLRTFGPDLVLLDVMLPGPSGFELCGLIRERGRTPIIIAAAVVLPASGIIAAFAPTDSVATLALALGLLGLGWNLGFVAGTAMITDATPLSVRASTQGSVDVVVSLSGAGAGATSGQTMTAFPAGSGHDPGGRRRTTGEETDG